MAFALNNAVKHHTTSQYVFQYMEFLFDFVLGLFIDDYSKLGPLFSFNANGRIDFKQA